jgi:hypothetical protein
MRTKEVGRSIELLVWIEKACTYLIRGKRLAFAENLEASWGRIVECCHHEMQIRSQRPHTSNFFLLST